MKHRVFITCERKSDYEDIKIDQLIICRSFRSGKHIWVRNRSATFVILLRAKGAYKFKRIL